MQRASVRVTLFLTSRPLHVEINVWVMPMSCLQIVYVLVKTLLLFMLKKTEPKGHRIKYNLLKTWNNID